MKIFNLLQEAKDHLINKLNLTDEQKNRLILFFKRRPDLESSVDWNRKDLDWNYWDEFTYQADRQITKGNLKAKGLDIFEPSEDYIDISISPNYFAFIPLNYNFQNFIQNTKFYGTEAKWCIGSNSEYHWDNYQKDSDFVILIEKETGVKIAWQIQSHSFAFWNMMDFKTEGETISDCDFSQYGWNNATQEELDFINKIESDLPTLLEKFDYYMGDDGSAEFEFSEPKIFVLLDAYTEGKFYIGNSNLTKRRKFIKTQPLSSYKKDFSQIEILRMDEETKEKITYIDIPKNLELPEYYFEECYELSYAVFEEGINYIEKTLFAGCDSLEKITFPKGLKYIGNYAFSGCFTLDNIEFPETLEEIGFSAFDGNSELTKVDLSKTQIKNIPSEAFKQCTSLEEVILPKTCEYIDDEAFEGCYSLRQINLEVLSDGWSKTAFEGCKDLNIQEQLLRDL